MICYFQYNLEPRPAEKFLFQFMFKNKSKKYVQIRILRKKLYVITGLVAYMANWPGQLTFCQLVAKKNLLKK
ncbi:hypothetical protein BpHYR1_015842 [Brachionus plicatilis]|uniref:Uncharacterized protein n=1 Tax=Brachionus plicatilis TaxID=10195 RepID=A0A3M7RIL2_BRAPC|nr:hypothetical protein BpHYR1_015842 [Brachionus plicatilis]